MNEREKTLVSIIIILILVIVGIIIYNNKKTDNKVADDVELSSDYKVGDISSEKIKTDLNKTSTEYAKASKIMWSSFSCSILAGDLEKYDLSEKLFINGYENGLLFLRAAYSEKIEDKDYSSEVPVGVSMNMGGPNYDFILGNIFNTISDDLSDSLYGSGADYVVEDNIRSVIANNEFNSRNCELLVQ